MKTIKVKAAKGLKCPKEGKPREYITDEKEVVVPASPYYNRLVMEGSLVCKGLRDEKIIDFMSGLVASRANLGKDGKPDLPVIKEKTGYSITAKERDVLWAGIKDGGSK